MEKQFEYFMSRLRQAGSKIDCHYFQVHTAGAKEAVFRERVYCYELYHQLRNALGDDFPYKLDGEIDKRGHRVIQGKWAQKNPDFVVHQPGNMDRNLAIIEVKTLQGARNAGALEKDLETLQGFLDKVQYHRALMVIYGNGTQELSRSIVNKIEEARTKDDRIMLVWHRGPGETPEVVSRTEA